MPIAATSLASGPAIEAYDSIDDILGDGRHRFFSQGYKNTNPMLRGLRVSHTVPESTLTATASLGVQGSWSVKGTSAQTPHLGTTDVLVLAARAAEALLASRYSPDVLPAAYIRSVTISGGSQPVEDSLADLPCTASLQTVTNPDADSLGLSFLRCSVASMSAELELVHGVTELGLASVQSPSEDALVGDAGTRLYGKLWTQRQVSLLDVAVNPDDGTVGARVTVRQHPGTSGESPLPHGEFNLPQGERNGLEAAYPKAMSAVEHFVAALQLGQVLLYRLDAMSRAKSNTLWMRKTRISLQQAGPTAVDGTGAGSHLDVRLRRSRLIAKDGETWRVADVVGKFDGGEVVCSVAHQLPDDVVGAHAAGAQR
ncbi:AvrD family protein [Arthrobacter sp. M4]|uniref:AvrD family protein n=1 Tax=Arthrobacter sp. M4 TaxID=218160 RepID=UPI001CDBEE82|nr:AvrD family protein [Arthrobacter sp. M4]MCA4135044.1 hypothetical protein [Arthrobacter sp. M4]